MQFIWKTCCVFKIEVANTYCFKFPLELNTKMPLGRNRNCGKECTCLRVTPNINMSSVIRKIATEAVSPSLSSFEGHFAARRRAPNALPERGAHPLSEAAGSAADRIERAREEE